MRILIYGAGAVGSYLGGHLALAGHEVMLLGRPLLVDAVRAHGLRLRLIDGERTVRSIEAVATPDEALSRPHDLIAFTMKAYDTVPAIFEIQQRLVDNVPPIVSFQNGIGAEDSLRAAFGTERVIAGTLTSPVSLAEPGLVVEERRRGVAIASSAPAARTVESALRVTGLKLAVLHSAEALKWSKLLLNLIGNATCAILDMSPDEVFGDKRLFQVEYQALREALDIMALQHIPVVNLPGTPARTLALAIRTLPAGLLRVLLRKQVSGGRGAKMPSLQASLHSGQRRTEVAWLNGAVVRGAEAVRRYAPVNHALALTLSDIAAGRIPWETYRRQPEMLLTAVSAAARRP
ncbi:MAG: 2-dehydropantoate 2-reductase [Anaerolineae bacterium]